VFFELVERPFLVRGGMRDAIDFSTGGQSAPRAQ